MNYVDTVDYLYDKLPFFQKLGEKAIKPKLTNIINLCEALQMPQNSFKSVHIAGTNGKGSSSHFMASILQEAGYKVGLYTSPHLKDFRERFRINGDMMPKSFVINFVKKHKPLIEKIEPSFFELTVVMAFQYFKESTVDIAIIEVGLGGRYDSTNIIEPIASLITNIGFDHMHILGNTLTEIADQKAGIIKKNTPVVISEYLNETKPVFLKNAKEQNAKIIFAQEQFEVENITQDSLSLHLNIKGENVNLKIESGLSGTYQTNNIRGCVAMCILLHELGLKIDAINIQNGLRNVLRNTNLKGRWQHLQNSPTVICDTGHNEHAFRIIVENLKGLKKEKLKFILAFVLDKDLEKIFALLPLEASYVFTCFDSQRAEKPEKLAELASKRGLNHKIAKNVNAALTNEIKKAGKNDVIYVGGSTYLVAEIKNL